MEPPGGVEGEDKTGEVPGPPRFSSWVVFGSTPTPGNSGKRGL